MAQMNYGFFTILSTNRIGIASGGIVLSGRINGLNCLIIVIQLIEILEPMRRFLLLFLLGPLFCFGQTNNVGIGTNTPDNSAILDVSSTSKGVLVPRLNTLQRQNIATPVNGLLVYDTDLDCFYFYQSSLSNWQSLCITTGLQGATGPTGPIGATGPSGGPPGPIGPTGSSSYDIYALKGDTTTVSSLYPIFTEITGFDTTITITDTADISIFTTGKTFVIGQYGGYPAIIQVYINGVPLPDTFDEFLTSSNNTPGWSISKTLELLPGVYNFKIKASKYSQAPLPILSDMIVCPCLPHNNDQDCANRHCNMTIQVFYR